MPVEKFEDPINYLGEWRHYTIYEDQNMIYRTSKAVAPYEIKTWKIFVITRLAKWVEVLIPMFSIITG